MMIIWYAQVQNYCRAFVVRDKQTQQQQQKKTAKRMNERKLNTINKICFHTVFPTVFVKPRGLLSIFPRESFLLQIQQRKRNKTQNQQQNIKEKHYCIPFCCCFFFLLLFFVFSIQTVKCHPFFCCCVVQILQSSWKWKGFSFPYSQKKDMITFIRRPTLSLYHTKLKTHPHTHTDRTYCYDNRVKRVLLSYSPMRQVAWMSHNKTH